MYIVGIDIAKRFHEATIIDKAGKVVFKRICFANSHARFLKFMEAIRKLDAPAEFGMEATGHYWLSLYVHLCQAGQTVYVINPLQSDDLGQYVSASDKERHNRCAKRCRGHSFWKIL